ncbi:MAG: TetR/AcrR family transcriptional regulator [Roseococcus sp.]|nr:TetR/AcrR family transcriptional regulator [Roseococcus sp.]
MNASSARRARPSARRERSEKLRAALFEAAARVVGRHGYAGASVARITAAARIAQGSFYTYFPSRQALLDELLPKLGEEMLAHIAAAVAGAGDEIAREERRFRAFFEFLQRRPAFFRILHEAEFFAPRGFRRHIDNIARDYRRALGRARARGALAHFTEAEVEPLVFLLMAARSYTSMRYAYAPGGKVRPPPEELVSAYLKLLRHGLDPGGSRDRKPNHDS